MNEFLENISIDSIDIVPLKCHQKSNSHKYSASPKHTEKKPKGGYRPVLVNENELPLESTLLEPYMQIINNKEGTNLMSDQDIVSYYILVYLNQRYPNNFLENVMSIVKKSDCKVISSKLISELPLKFKNPRISSRLSSLNLFSLFDVVNFFNLHSVPFSARSTLVNWYLGNKFDLVLFINRIPTSKQVLKMQANSKRCVTLIGKIQLF